MRGLHKRVRVLFFCTHLVRFSLIDEKYESLGLYNEKEGITEVEGNLYSELKFSLKTIFSE